MANIFLVAAIVSVIFFVAKFLEMRYIDDEPKPLKILIRDTLLCYVSVVLGYFIIDQLNPIINETVSSVGSPLVFTDNPPF